MRSFQLVGRKIDAEPILNYIHENEWLWHADNFRQSYKGTAHKDTESIFLRWAPHNTAESIQGSLASLNRPEFEKIPGAKRIVNNIFKMIDGKQLGRVLIVKLKPGGQISPHVDEGFYANHFDRFHLCLQSDNAHFYVDTPEPFVNNFEMMPGQLWWFDHRRKHWAVNNGKTDRINMIIDAVAPHFRSANAAH